MDATYRTTTLKCWFSIYCGRICICMLDATTITVNFHPFNNVYKSIIYVCQTFLLITAVLSKVCPAGGKKVILYIQRRSIAIIPFLLQSRDVPNIHQLLEFPPDHVSYNSPSQILMSLESDHLSFQFTAFYHRVKPHYGTRNQLRGPQRSRSICRYYRRQLRVLRNRCEGLFAVLF